MSAIFSPCRTWRYRLERRWGEGPLVAFILLNPSTADETMDDPTIRRCIGYAKTWGYGGLVVGNIFALRSTDPKVLQSADDPVGPENDEHLLAIAESASVVICGWGAHGKIAGRGHEVMKLLQAHRPKYLKMTKLGAPQHPLYLKGDLTPRDWEKEGET